VSAQQKFEANPSKATPPNLYGLVRSQFALGIALYHGWNLLHSNGMKVLKNYLLGMQEKVNSGGDVSKAKKSLIGMQSFKNLMLMLNELTDKGSNHPKLERVVEIIHDHFRMLSISILHASSH